MNEESKQGAPGGASEDEHNCALCRVWMFLEDGAEWSDTGQDICNRCAQDELPRLRASLSTAEKERDEALRETNRTFNTMQDRLAEKIDCQQSGTEEACCDCVTCWMDRASDAEERLAALSGSNIEDAPTAPKASEVASDSSALEKALGALRAVLDVFGGHSSHWDPTMRNGAGCDQCNRELPVRAAARDLLSALSGGAHVDGPGPGDRAAKERKG